MSGARGNALTPIRVAGFRTRGSVRPVPGAGGSGLGRRPAGGHRPADYNKTGTPPVQSADHPKEDGIRTIFPRL